MSGDIHVAAPIFDPQYTNVHRIARLVKKCIALNYANFFEVVSFRRIIMLCIKQLSTHLNCSVSLRQCQQHLLCPTASPPNAFKVPFRICRFFAKLLLYRSGKFIERMMSVLLSFDLVVSRRPPTQVTSDWAGVQRYDS